MEDIKDICKQRETRFRHIYPESDVHIIDTMVFPNKDNKAIIQAAFPDGEFFFIVDEHSVSSSYNSLDDAKRHL